MTTLFIIGMTMYALIALGLAVMAWALHKRENTPPSQGE